MSCCFNIYLFFSLQFSKNVFLTIFNLLIFTSQSNRVPTAQREGKGGQQRTPQPSREGFPAPRGEGSFVNATNNGRLDFRHHIPYSFEQQRPSLGGGWWEGGEWWLLVFRSMADSEGRPATAFTNTLSGSGQIEKRELAEKPGSLGYMEGKSIAFLGWLMVGHKRKSTFL